MEIQDFAFQDCKNLQEVELKESALKTIGRAAFGGCGKLEKIVLPEELEKIDCSAFEETGLAGIEFPASLRTIDHGAFYKCKNLRTVRFGEGLEVLGVISEC